MYLLQDRRQNCAKGRGYRRGMFLPYCVWLWEEVLPPKKNLMFLCKKNTLFGACLSAFLHTRLWYIHPYPLATPPTCCAWECRDIPPPDAVWEIRQISFLKLIRPGQQLYVVSRLIITDISASQLVEELQFRVVATHLENQEKSVI